MEFPVHIYNSVNKDVAIHFIMQLLKVVVKSKTHFFLGNIVFSFRVEMNHYAK